MTTQTLKLHARVAARKRGHHLSRFKRIKDCPITPPPISEVYEASCRCCNHPVWVIPIAEPGYFSIAGAATAVNCPGSGSSPVVTSHSVPPPAGLVTRYNPWNQPFQVTKVGDDYLDYLHGHLQTADELAKTIQALNPDHLTLGAGMMAQIRALATKLILRP